MSDSLPHCDWGDALREPLLASEHPPLQQPSAPQDHHPEEDGQQQPAANPEQSVGADVLYNEPYAPPPDAYYEDADATAAAADAQPALGAGEAVLCLKISIFLHSSLPAVHSHLLTHTADSSQPPHHTELTTH